MSGFLSKILGSGGTSYPTYLDPLVPLFGIFSLWRPVTSAKLNGYTRKLNRFFAWIFSIDWYLNWPYSNIFSWFMVHERVLGGAHMRGIIDKIFFIDFKNFFSCFVGFPGETDFDKKNKGSTRSNLIFFSLFCIFIFKL
jgi:hypothetical protein